MAKPYISLQPSEGIIIAAAANIYAAYISAGRVEDAQESEWMERSIREAIRIARTVDESIQSDAEMD